MPQYFEPSSYYAHQRQKCKELGIELPEEDRPRPVLLPYAERMFFVRDRAGNLRAYMGFSGYLRYRWHWLLRLPYYLFRYSLHYLIVALVKLQAR